MNRIELAVYHLPGFIPQMPSDIHNQINMGLRHIQITQNFQLA